MTNVPAISFTPTGATAPTESAISDGLWADFQEAFGGALNDSPATPQGQIITSLAAILGANNDLFLQLMNQIDPAFADGRMQDAIARIYYLSRIGARPTSVVCDCMGASGTIIPEGSLAQATDGTIYASTFAAAISDSGVASITFEAQEPGPIACPAGTLTSIYRVVPGWDAITNAADGIIGRATETRAELEERRLASVALNSRALVPSIRGAVLNVTGVIDAYVTENPGSSPVTTGGVTIAAHSLYACVYGGSDDDVAHAIWSKKPPGCGYTGSTTITVLDTESGYDPPYPSYSVTFQRAAPTQIYMAVSIANNSQVPSNAAILIRDAIVSAFSGADGGGRERIGGTVYALRYAGPIASLGSWVQLVSIAVGVSSSPTASDVVMDIDQMPVIDGANITVALV